MSRSSTIIEDRSGVLIQDQPHQRLILLHSSLPSPATHLDHAARAPPLSVGMWAGSFSLDGRIGEGRTQGGPRKWEAHTVRQENEPRQKSWFVFCLPFYSTPLTPPFPMPAYPTITTEETWQQRNNATTAPTSAQRQPQQHNDNHNSTTTTATAQ